MGGGLPFDWLLRGGKPFAGPRAFALYAGPGDGEARFGHAGVRLRAVILLGPGAKDTASFKTATEILAFQAPGFLVLNRSPSSVVLPWEYV